MNINDAEAEETKRLTCGNESAGQFLRIWRSYVHGIDDIIDGDIKAAEGILAVFMQAAFVYTHPFFVAHAPQLKQIAINCTNAYADSVMWEKAGGWRQEFSDHYRHFAVEMVIAIASICGGYSHARQMSPVLRELCWTEHHNEKGEVV